MSFSVSEEIDENEFEELIAKAQEESLRHYNEVESVKKLNADVPQENDILSSQFGGKAGSLLYQGIEAKGFHHSAGSTYIYPTNYPVRQYQASIVKTALFKNTLVSLPTGLGKTFIAAVVMYNFYRWYPHGKVVFMAPTRPLVAQQTKACHHIMNIPQDDTTEMTGMLSAEQRTSLWRSKRVFFLTPQVMVNDLKAKICPAELVKCVVIDEAHRATKDYAYCQVLKILSETDAVFRVLGLSATPGNDVNAVQQVLKNLHIAALELRSEESLDVAPYIHSRDINKIVVELSGNIVRVKEDLLQVFEKYARKLKDFKALSYNISSISKFQVLKACEKFRSNPPRGVPQAMIGSLISDFTVCMSLAHSLELLQIYGLRAFYTYLTDDSGDKSKAAISRLKNDEHLREMLKRLQGCLYPKPTDNCPYTWGHPKLQRLVGALNEHFQKESEKKTSTKAIVFCQYRVVVTEIVDLLNKSKPLILAAEFIGQSGGKEKGMPQAKQLQIMKDFRNGIVNCLVATCVAEEGLDIGEVDLIVLMEAHKSPVRLVQRLGRTGRKRRGCCIVLLTKGKEEQKFLDAMAIRKSYIKNIVNAPAVKASLAEDSPRMIPPGCNPVQQLVHIHASNFKSPARPGASKKQADIRKCFTAQEIPQHTSDQELLSAYQELGSSKLSFGAIPGRHELWHRRHDTKISLDELFSKDVSRLSEWNDWNHDEQETFLVGHSSGSRLLSHLLRASSGEVSLPSYASLNDGILDEKDYPAEKDSPKGRKRKKKEPAKKNMGMDIRSCLASAVDKNKDEDCEIIEILSEESNDVFHIPSSEQPPLKKVRSSLSEQDPNKVDSKLSCYEENNNLIEFLNRYARPKNGFKKPFSFQRKLPVLEEFIERVTSDILLRLDINNFGKVGLTCDFSVQKLIPSPFSESPFEVDDLFAEDKSSIKDESPIGSVMNSPQKFDGDLAPNIDGPENGRSSSPFDIDSILNDRIDPLTVNDSPLKDSQANKVIVGISTPSQGQKSMSSSFYLNSGEKLLSFKFEEDSRIYDSQSKKALENDVPVSMSFDLDAIFNDANDPLNKLPRSREGSVDFGKPDSNKSTPTRSVKTLTSSFVNLQRSNKKIFEGFRDKKKTIYRNDQIKSTFCGSEAPLKPIPEEEMDSFFPNSENFDFADDAVFNQAGVSNMCSTPLKSSNLFSFPKKSEIVQSPISVNEFAPSSNLASSTPLISVKKFKKNTILTDPNSKDLTDNSEIVPQKLDATNSLKVTEIKKSPSPVDIWNLSDVLEEEENENHIKPQESTMFGITQMVSLIEKEKNERKTSAQTIEENQKSNSNLLPNDDSVNSSKKSKTSDNLSVFLESDTDIFCDVNVNANVDDPYKDTDFMLTQKYNQIKSPGDCELKVNESKFDDDFIKVAKSSDDEEIADDKHDDEVKSSHCRITLSDDFDYGDLILTQKYNFVSPKKSGVSEEKGSNSLPNISDENITNSSDNKIEASKNIKNSEPPPNPSQSQLVNFKKFSKKIVFPQTPLETIKKDNVSPSKDSQMFIINSSENVEKLKNNSPCKNIQSFSEQMVKSKTKDEFSELLDFNFSEPKARVSLFQTKIGQTKKAHFLSDDSDDEIFVLPSSVGKQDSSTKKAKISSSDSSSLQDSARDVKGQKKNRKKKKLKDRYGLIEKEADVSGTLSTDDSDGSSLDDLDNSFINDDTECFTQTMYLKSVRSPVNRGKFKIPSRVDHRSDIYSQQAVEQDSSYMNDSFCVGSDEGSSGSEEDQSLSILEIAERKLRKSKKMKKRRHRPSDRSSEEDGSESPHKKSSTDCTSSEPVVRSSAPLKRRRVLSDSESDGSPFRKKGLKSSPFS